MKNARINERIGAHRVVLIDKDGTNKGEILKFAALEMARKDGLDLVEVSIAPVPVCKIMDFGKVQYEKQKSEKHQSSRPLHEGNAFRLQNRKARP
jgi:translation initiation factor IF-3